MLTTPSESKPYTPELDNPEQIDNTSAINNTNKRPRSVSPNSNSLGVSASSSPKRTMSEEHLQSRESSPVVSLSAGDSLGTAGLPTRMAEVFPSPTMTNREVPEVELSDPSSNSMHSVLDQADRMEIDSKQEAAPTDPLPESAQIPTLQEQFQIIQAAVSVPLQPDQLFYLIPSAWYLLLRHLAYPEDYPAPKKLPSAAIESRVNVPDVKYLYNPMPSANLLDRNGPAIKGNQFYGTCQSKLTSSDYKLLPNQVEFVQTGKKGKDATDEPEGTMVYLEASGWEKILEWYGNEHTDQFAVKRKVISDSQGGLKIELNPPTFKLFRISPSSSSAAHLPSNDKPYRLSISVADQVSELHQAVRNAFEIDGDDQTRLWTLQTSPNDVAQAQYKAGEEARIDPELDGPSTTIPNAQATRQLPSHLLSVLGGKCISTLPKAASGDDPVLGDADFEDGDSVALEVAETVNGEIRWVAKLTEIGTAEEIPVPSTAPPPLFSTPPLFAGGSGASKEPSNSAATTRSGDTSPPKRKQPRGLKGLSNLGNTCFMNSGLQCLSNTKELSEYFQRGVHKKEINRQNPLGMGGSVADKFGSLIEQIWSESSSSSSGSTSRGFYGGYSNAISPREFKQMIGRFAPSFAGYGQQDTQELIAFLLDGLHEDLNRIMKKPYIEKPDWKDGGSAEDLALFAKECWDGYKKRNDSVIVDLFQGQLKSTLICPDCKKKSITLDPFMYLTVPIPFNKIKAREFFVQRWNAKEQRIRVRIQYTASMTYADIKKKISEICGIPSHQLLTTDEYGHKFWSIPSNGTSVTTESTDTIVFHELPCPVTQTHHGSRAVLKDGEDLIIVPVYSYAPSTRSHGETIFGHPFFIGLTAAQAQDPNEIRKAVARGYSGFVGYETEDEWNALITGTSNPREDDDASTTGMAENVDELSISKDSNINLPEGTRPGKSPVRENHPPSPLSNVFDITLFGPRKSSAEGFISCDPERGRRETLAERRRPKSGVIHRVRNAFEKFAGSTPASEDEEERPSPQLVFTHDIIAVEWKDTDMMNKFLGHKHLGRYADPAAFLTHVDGAIEAEKRKNEKRLKNGVSLEDCLDEFEREETLGENDLWYCSNCKKHQAATKKMEIYHAPDILVICFKRFSSFGTYSRSKIDLNVEFPVEGLNLEDRCDEQKLAKALVLEGKELGPLGLENTAKPLIYDLYAVDQHYGSCGGGHYTAVCKNADDGNWYSYDDSSVSMTNVSSAQNSAAYLLFYRRRTEQNLGGTELAEIEANAAAASKFIIPPSVEPTSNRSLSPSSSASSVQSDIFPEARSPLNKYSESDSSMESPTRSISGFSSTGNFVSTGSGGVEWDSLEKGLQRTASENGPGSSRSRTGSPA